MAEALAKRDEEVPGKPAPQPFLKWVGGKRQLLDSLLSKVPTHYNRYYEPFLGGGAFFFALMPPEAYLSDLNAQLIETYIAVRDQTDSLISNLQKHRYEKNYFYQVRKLDREEGFQKLSSTERAARFIYLNRTCFNGLYRVNKDGFFNVPFGRYTNPKIVNAPLLSSCACALRHADLSVRPYQEITGSVQSGDFVYLDPPYAPLTETSNFTGYQENGFSAKDQEALHDFCRKLDEKGVFWMQSNSSAPLITDLYREFRIESVSANRSVNSQATGRGPVQELIIRNY